jgi:autotransporter-associated beta strand protein
MKITSRFLYALHAAGASVIFLSLGAPATAATVTWSGGGGDSNWNTALNWGGTAPVAADSLIFAGTTRVAAVNNITANTSFASIAFSAGASAFTLSGNSIALNAAKIINSSANLQTINTAIATSTTLGLVNTTTGGTTIGGIISGAGAMTVNNTGTGVTTLSGANTYTGTTTTTTTGTLRLGSATALGTTAGITTVTLGTLDLTQLENSRVLRRQNIPTPVRQALAWE